MKLIIFFLKNDKHIYMCACTQDQGWWEEPLGGEVNVDEAPRNQTQGGHIQRWKLVYNYCLNPEWNIVEFAWTFQAEDGNSGHLVQFDF